MCSIPSPLNPPYQRKYETRKELRNDLINFQGMQVEASHEKIDFLICLTLLLY
jgi:hypothetical protein